MPHWIQAGTLADFNGSPCVAVQVGGQTLVLVRDDGRVYALDNRCPHMGFPLHRGSVKDGILTCHWHHARFDLCTGGTFDQWADDDRAFPVELRGDQIWVDVSLRVDPVEHQRERLQVGLERNISLVTGKAVLTLLENDPAGVEPFRAGLDFGCRYRQPGWGPGLTILTCVQNLLPILDADDRPRALFHGLAAVANDCDGMPPRFPVRPLPDDNIDVATLKRWFRRFVEVRDAEGAERCLCSALRAGATAPQMADMLFAAATDHRYINIGHVLDFTNKAFEALDHAGWDLAEPVLTSLAGSYASADRMEESNAWRHPIDLVEILDGAFAQIPAALEAGRAVSGWDGRDELVPVLLADNPQAIADALVDALRRGCRPAQLAGTVAYAAALRIARFHTSNEFADWDTALHTFTFSNAVQQGLKRAESAELLRGVFDAAISVYLDRFLNVPTAPLPKPSPAAGSPAEILAELSSLLNERHRVSEAAQLVADYFAAGGTAAPMLARIPKLLLREDRDFHTIQTVEAALRQFHELRDTPVAANVLVAAIRYLAAHAPTVRAQGQTYQIALRLHRGEHLFEGTEA